MPLGEALSGMQPWQPAGWPATSVMLQFGGGFSSFARCKSPQGCPGIAQHPFTLAQRQMLIVALQVSPRESVTLERVAGQIKEEGHGFM